MNFVIDVKIIKIMVVYFKMAMWLAIINIIKLNIMDDYCYYSLVVNSFSLFLIKINKFNKK